MALETGLKLALSEKTEDWFCRDEAQLEKYQNYEILCLIIEARCEKTSLRGFANNKCADQPAHSCRLINAIVIRQMESKIFKLATSEISIF